jgi:hypothetical protein
MTQLLVTDLIKHLSTKKVVICSVKAVLKREVKVISPEGKEYVLEGFYDHIKPYNCVSIEVSPSKIKLLATY